ncbi:hypothetical protein Tsp_02176, partial [Trichinella spiralis]|uniref:hypothetical protein n=1 Tax=Trichinella spiralis TaxID=6334 RepID=UPI0001EFC4B7
QTPSPPRGERAVHWLFELATRWAANTGALNIKPRRAQPQHSSSARQKHSAREARSNPRKLNPSPS